MHPEIRRYHDAATTDCCHCHACCCWPTGTRTHLLLLSMRGKPKSAAAAWRADSLLTSAKGATGTPAAAKWCFWACLSCRTQIKQKQGAGTVTCDLYLTPSIMPCRIALSAPRATAHLCTTRVVDADALDTASDTAQDRSTTKVVQWHWGPLPE